MHASVTQLGGKPGAGGRPGAQPVRARARRDHAHGHHAPRPGHAGAHAADGGEDRRAHAHLVRHAPRAARAHAGGQDHGHHRRPGNTHTSDCTPSPRCNAYHCADQSLAC